MPKRSFSGAGAYRYGFNGKENDNDVEGLGNQQDYGMRIYDPRLGRFLSVDPLQKDYPELTPYQFAGNTPIQALDLDGKEIYHYLLEKDKGGTPALTYLGVQTRDYAWWEIYDKHQPAYSFPNFQGDLITTKIVRVWLGTPYRDGDTYYVGKLSPVQNFSSFKELNEWKAAGFPATPPKPVDPETAEQVQTMTTLLMNEMYFRYDMSDGAMDFDAAPDISKLFSKPKSSPTEKPNNQTSSAHQGNKNAEVNNKTATEWNGPVDYTVLPEPRNAGPGKKFTPTQKANAIELNKQKNGGVIRDDVDGTILNPPKQDKPGVKTDMNSAQLDHINARKPKDKTKAAGSNKNSNISIRSKGSNIKKSNN